MALTIWHNPRCSKSRETLALLEERGLAPRIVLYRETPPTSAEIKDVLYALGARPRDIIRKGEDAYKNLALENQTISDTALLHAMEQHPELIERPIVINGKKAALGRPPENVLAIL